MLERGVNPNLLACSVGVDLGDWSGNQARWLKKAKMHANCDKSFLSRDLSQDCCELWRPYTFLRLRLNEIQVPDAFSLVK